MPCTIGICPDDYTSRMSPEKRDASSPLWAELLKKAGHRVKWVNVRHPDILEQLRDCQGFMWRWAHFRGMGRIARRLLPVIERQMGLAVYPDQNTCWHYDDKIAQAHLLKSLDLPMPKTWVWFDWEEAKKWARGADYPMVLKLSTGAGSSNVRLIRSAAEAENWIDYLFRRRVVNLDRKPDFIGLSRLWATAQIFCRGRSGIAFDNGVDPQSGYALFQEYLADNSFDTRVTIIGRRAFAFRRFNRTGDFRASGSGMIDVTPEAIDVHTIRLAYRVAQSLCSQSVAIDGLRRGQDRVVGEVSYTYASWAVHCCPGHWELQGEPQSGSLEWHPGSMWPEEAQIEDFLGRLRSLDKQES